MPDDTTPEPTPENAYPPPSSAYPPPNDPPNPPPPGTPYANPYGNPAPPPPNPYGTPNTPPPSNPYAQSQTNPPPNPYGTPGPQSNWQPPPPVGAYGAAPSPVNGQTILIMGIVSIFCLQVILGPIAWIMGNNGLKTLDQYGDPLGQRSNVNTGRICGMVGTILGILGIVGYIAMMILGIATSGMHPSSY